MQDAITQTEYRALQQAYDFFNAELFECGLPQALITLQRYGKAYGYFSPERFVGRTEQGESVNELAMNPDHFGRTDELILSTLVHEMVHVWQQAHGKPPRRSYHDKQWATKMKEVGLQPSDTRQPGGKETGQKVSHYVIEGGAFAKAFAKRVLRRRRGRNLHDGSRRLNFVTAGQRMFYDEPAMIKMKESGNGNNA